MALNSASGEIGRFRLRGVLTVPIISVMAASLVQALPFAAAAPTLPPFGFMLFLSWRLMRSDLLPPWSGILLGAWDDMFSGQPIGSAMATWTMCALALDVVDLRVVWRDYRLDLIFAAPALCVVLIGSALLARVDSAADLVRLVGPQIAWSLLLMPLVMRLGRGARPVADRRMKLPWKKSRPGAARPLLTEGLQRLSFSRRALFLSGAQVGLGGLLATRMGYISVVDAQKYRLKSESNRVNLTLIPPRRGWIIDRYGKALADNRVALRVDIIPDRLRDADRVVGRLAGAAIAGRRRGRSHPPPDR